MRNPYKVTDGDSILGCFRTKREAQTYLSRAVIDDVPVKDAGFYVVRVSGEFGEDEVRV